MINFLALNIIFLTFLIIFSSKSIAADRILPLKKPTVDQETKIITAKKKEIYIPKHEPTKSRLAKIIKQFTTQGRIMYKKHSNFNIGLKF